MSGTINWYYCYTGNIFLQLATQQCWKALLHVLPQASNIATQQNFVVASWKLAATCCFNLQQRNCVAWRYLRWVVICATTLFNFCSNLLLTLLHFYYITHYFPVSSRKPYFKLHYLAIGIDVTYKVRQWSHKPAVDQGNKHTNPSPNPEGTEHRRIIVKTREKQQE